jgi:hypothetical protein
MNDCTATHSHIARGDAAGTILECSFSARRFALSIALAAVRDADAWNIRAAFDMRVASCRPGSRLRVSEELTEPGNEDQAVPLREDRNRDHNGPREDMVHPRQSPNCLVAEEA